VEHQSNEPQTSGAIELFGERRDRLSPKRRLSSGYVDEVAGVSHHGAEPRPRDRLAKRRHLRVFERAGAPLTNRLREDLQHVAAGGDGAIDRSREAPSDGQVSAEERHRVTNDRARATALPLLGWASLP
jgi:hypothetical protein